MGDAVPQEKDPLIWEGDSHTLDRPVSVTTESLLGQLKKQPQMELPEYDLFTD